MTTFQESILTGVIGGIISGLFIYLIQAIVEYIKDKKNINESKKVGKRIEKYITEDFLYNYEPGNLTIEKVIQDFGQCDEKAESINDIELEDDDRKEITLFTYKFNNAIVLFSTFPNDSTIISITINSSFIKAHPVKCRLMFTDDDQYFGKAKITSEIISNMVDFKNESFTNWAYSSIKSRYFNRQIKHLFFSYIVCDVNIENENELLNKQIDQLCLSVNQNICPVIYFYDMI